MRKYLLRYLNTDKRFNLYFTGKNDYGISSGNITGQIGEKLFQVGKISKGTAEVSLDKETQQIVMLNF